MKLTSPLSRRTKDIDKRFNHRPRTFHVFGQFFRCFVLRIVEHCVSSEYLVVGQQPMSSIRPNMSPCRIYPPRTLTNMPRAIHRRPVLPVRRRAESPASTRALRLSNTHISPTSPPSAYRPSLPSHEASTPKGLCLGSPPRFPCFCCQCSYSL